MVLTDCCKSVGSSDLFLEVFARLSHLSWYVLQSAEEIVGQRLNPAPTEDSETVVFLVLGSNSPPVAGPEGFGFDSPAMVPAEVELLPKR